MNDNNNVEYLVIGETTCSGFNIIIDNKELELIDGTTNKVVIDTFCSG